ncbi:MAG: UDP-N-acetylglucosamine 2-epimerase (hydrolyzing) [Azospirillum sp.]|nr:UDP-N-acetylglucosamine 2-epimerase (hydrolyzing) [Azospirillum sp.]
MKLVFVTGSRGEWGYIRPILRLCEQRGIDYSLCVTNMVLLPGYGTLIDEIRAEGFRVSDEIYMSLEGHNHFTMAKSLAVFLGSFVDTVYRLRPSWIVLAGDRGEQLAAAITGAYTYTPVAHIQAGERSGNIDGVARHALGKFAHLHFAANQDAADRLLKLGEEAFRIHVVGAPQLDELATGQVTSVETLKQRYQFDCDRPYLLVIQHPVTEELDQVGAQVTAMVEALERFDMPKLWILSNNDAGSHALRRTLLQLRRADIRIVENLTRQDFLGFMKHCAAMLGNSSSGLLEAPTFRIAAVNLGRRQADRVQGQNVINAPFEVGAIADALTLALSPDFQARLRDSVNPYGDGRSAERILDTLAAMPIDNRLLIKQLTY